MDEFLERLKSAHASRAIGSEQSLSNRVARALRSYFSLAQDPDSDDGLIGFYADYPDFPVRLYTERCATDMAVLLRKPFKTKLWDAWRTRVSESSSARVGIAATLGSSSIHVLHNLLTMPTPVGTMLQLKNETGMTARFETLPQFMDSVRQIWVPS
jgi:hypothetical protein